MIKYCVNTKKNKVIAYFSDNNGSLKGKNLWRRYLLDTIPKVFDLYNSYIYVDADKFICNYIKDVNVTCVVNIHNGDVETAKEIAKRRLIKKYAKCGSTVLMSIMKRLHNNVIEVEKRVNHRLAKNQRKEIGRAHV